MEQDTGPSPSVGPGPVRPESLPAEPTRAEVETEIWQWAAGAATAGRRQATLMPRAMPFLGPEQPRFSRLPAAIAKKVVSRRVERRINPVIEHVNLLHRAVLDAIDVESDGDGRAAGRTNG